MAPKDTWRKAQRSQNDANCIELRNTLDYLRDSKNQDGPILRGDVRALVRAVRAGSLSGEGITNTP